MAPRREIRKLFLISPIPGRWDSKNAFAFWGFSVLLSHFFSLGSSMNYSQSAVFIWCGLVVIYYTKYQGAYLRFWNV